MQFAVIATKPAGLILTLQLINAGHEVVVCNQSQETMEELSLDGTCECSSLDELAHRLASPRAVWLMTSANKESAGYVDRLESILSPGDLVIESCACSHREIARRAKRFARLGLRYMDVAVSHWPQQVFMVGGEDEDFRLMEPVLASMGEHDIIHCGPCGSGHFTKSAHESVEDALVKAYSEARRKFDASPYRCGLGFEEFCLFRQILNRQACSEIFQEQPGNPSTRTLKLVPSGRTPLKRRGGSTVQSLSLALNS